MKITHPAHNEMLTALIEEQVDFLLVGGYSVIYHGYVRTTGDMDVWLQPTNENKLRLLEVFKKLQFDLDGIKTIEGMDFTEEVVFHIGEEPERIDFSSKAQELNFHEAYQQRQILSINKLQIPVLHLNDLIASKQFANRLKDQADIEHLLKIQKFKKTD
jgi:hypothetical protein